MNSRIANILTLVAAICAFLPVMGVDWLVGNYVRGKEQVVLEKQLGAVSDRIEAGAVEAMNVLDSLVNEQASLCTPSFLTAARSAIENASYIKDITVTNDDGVQYCDALGGTQTFAVTSLPLAIPGRQTTLAIGRVGTSDVPIARYSQAIGKRVVSIEAAVITGTPAFVLNRFRPMTMLRVTLTNGVPVFTGGDPSGFTDSPQSDFIVAETLSEAVPIRATAAVPFAIVRADYTDLTMTLTVIACLMSGAFLVMALQLVRRSKLPAFDLERAIAASEIKPYYQPVINLRTGELTGCEVLCRWEKRNGEVVMPGAFIDFAEITGLAIPMTLSLMQQVRNDMADLCARAPDLKISINLFEGHFRDSHIVNDVQAIFGNSSISFRQLVFEITERRPLANSDTAASVISGLHALGVRIAMDDVGTGHSNLAYMQTLGVDVIKIDRVFVEMIGPGTTIVPVLDGLIAMCRDLGTDIVAEGVETEAQAHYLRNRGVLKAQGYLFAPALKAKSFRQLADALLAARTPPKPADQSSVDEVSAAA